MQRPRPSSCRRIVSVEVRKSERRLEARCARGAVVFMTVALGREPHGPKRQRGDLKTPEGDYRVAGPARASRFYRFIPIDYPSPADADLGRADGRLSESEYRRIMAAHAEGRPPPGRTPLGGELGFHGEGLRWRGDSADLDWTYGCLAVTDAEMDFLAERLEPGTPVRILP